MTIQELNEKYSKFTGIRSNIGTLIEEASTTEEKQKLYDHLMWHLRNGLIRNRPWDKGLLDEIIPEIQEKLNIESSVVEDIEESETYTAEEAAAYNLTLEGALQYGAVKTAAVEAVEAQPAIYSFESFNNAAKEVKYGEGTVKVIEMRAGGATVEVVTNSTDQSFVGQQFNIATALATNDPIQLYTLENEPVDIWVTVELVSEAVEAVEAQEAVLYTNEEVDEINAKLDGAKHAGDVKE